MGKLDTDIVRFIADLKKWDHKKKGLGNFNIINMYNDTYVGKDNAKIRRDNLFFYLEKMKGLKPSRLFVGIAPGRNGCFLTGIPFTDIYTFRKNSFFEERKAKLNKKKLEQLIAESKDISSKSKDISTKVWERLKLLREKKLKLPLLWNIYPFQPLEDDAKKNRDPNEVERKIGITFLFKLLECFDIKEIYPLGKVAMKTLEENFPLIGHSLRHPSNDTEEDFIKQFNEIYQIETDESEEFDEPKESDESGESEDSEE